MAFLPAALLRPGSLRPALAPSRWRGLTPLALRIGLAALARLRFPALEIVAQRLREPGLAGVGRRFSAALRRFCHVNEPQKPNALPPCTLPVLVARIAPFPAPFSGTSPHDPEKWDPVF